MLNWYRTAFRIARKNKRSLHSFSTKVIRMSTDIKLFEEVEGLDDRKNNILYRAAGCRQERTIFSGVRTECRGNLVFFPGDLQDLERTMKKHHLSKAYTGWSYENTMNILSTKFPNCDIWIIVPSKKAYNTICVYKNFVKSESIMGVPTHTSNYMGLVHLQKLLVNAHLKAKAEFHPERSNTILIAFSKGCIVLNQFLHEISQKAASGKNEANEELEEPPKECPSPNFLKHITEWFWLDGGHSGEKDNWVTEDSVVSGLKQTPFAQAKFHIHLTPYQVRDPHRPYKGESQAIFSQLLLQHGFSVTEKMHFENDEPTIEQHLNVLRIF